MYNASTVSGMGLTGAAVIPFTTGTEPLWFLLGGFALIAAWSAVKRTVPTWSQVVGTGLEEEVAWSGAAAAA